MNNKHCSYCKHFWSKPEVGQMYCCKLKRRITAKKKHCKYFELYGYLDGFEDIKWEDENPRELVLKPIKEEYP